MDAPINELFEEGITRSRELSDAADEAMNAIDEMAREADDIAQRVQDEGGEACKHMRELASRLEQAEGDLESASGEARGALEGLAGKAAALESEAGDLLERVKTSLDEMASRQEQLDGSLDTQAASVQQDFQELVEKTGGAQSHAEEQLDQAEQAVADLQTTIERGRTEFLQKLHDWGTALEGFEDAVHARIDEWMAALEALLERQSMELVGAANAMVGRHNTAMDALKERFVEQAPQDLDTALDPLEAALEQMGVTAAEKGQGLATAARELEEWVGQAEPSLAPIQTALDSTDRLE